MLSPRVCFNFFRLTGLNSPTHIRRAPAQRARGPASSSTGVRRARDVGNPLKSHGTLGTLSKATYTRAGCWRALLSTGVRRARDIGKHPLSARAVPLRQARACVRARDVGNPLKSHEMLGTLSKATYTRAGHWRALSSTGVQRARDIGNPFKSHAHIQKGLRALLIWSSRVFIIEPRLEQ